MVRRLPFVTLGALAATLLAGAIASADSSVTFNAPAARQALEGVDLAPCRGKHGGDGHVTITFEPGGDASEAIVDRGPFASTKRGRCIEKRFRKTRVPAFDGPPVRVGKNFHVD